MGVKSGHISRFFIRGKELNVICVAFQGPTPLLNPVCALCSVSVSFYPPKKRGLAKKDIRFFFLPSFSLYAIINTAFTSSLSGMYMTILHVHVLVV